MNGRLQLARVLVLLCGVAAPSAFAQNDVMTFTKGSLIIPMQSNFQTSAGSLSAYGLVWRILHSNGPGGFNEKHPVTIYWIINGDKKSPNRCVPTNKHTPPSFTSDARWNDGCDIILRNDDQQPVVPVDYAAAWPATGTYPNAKVTNYDTTGLTVRPKYAAVASLDNAGTSIGSASTDRFNVIRYMGGPFVIDAADAQNVIDFLRGGTDAQTAQFITVGNAHYVQMHQATKEFTAIVARRINRVPPKIALLDSSSAGNVAGGILDDYLAAAGLNFVGAGGCPAGTKNGGCTAAPGQIYDKLNANLDLVSNDKFPKGLLNAKNADGTDRYKVFWAPHWVIADSAYASPSYVANGDGSASQAENALRNIAHFTNQRGHGIFAQCASLETYEGSFENGNEVVGPTKVAGWAAAAQFQYTNYIETDGLAGGDSYDGRNCTDPDYVSGECVMYPYPADPLTQVGDFSYESTGGHVHNYKPVKGGTTCTTKKGVETCTTVAPSDYRPGQSRLAVSWKDYTSGHTITDSAALSANADRGWDFFTTIQKDNDPQKGQIVYFAGHTYTNQTAGSRFVLNTLLNLGADPVSQERNLSAPVVFVDNNYDAGTPENALMVVGTYDAVSGLPPGSDSFAAATGSRWVFPLVPGHLRAHPVQGSGSLKAGDNALEDATLWDAKAQMPSPGDRNIFTYFGGQVKADARADAGVIAPYDVAQVGWRAENVSGLAINSDYSTVPNPSCVDVLKYGQEKKKDGTFKFGLIAGADGVCDLQQALQFSDITGGSDFGVTNKAANLLRLQNDADTAKMFLQRIRGYCWATSTKADGTGTYVLQPTDAQCNNPDVTNKAVMGGVVRSTPAVIPPSPNIADAPSGRKRPTVAYVGGWDGQLHAIYVSGGDGYTGPAGSLSFPNEAASAKFVTDWASRFASGGASLPKPGTELWSYLPATQLPWLRGNNARIDASPVVQDVFADFGGKGVREWHTVLVLSVGGTGRELAALDVTNPLKPVLLWHVVGSLYQVGSYPEFSPLLLTQSSDGPTDIRFKWKENDAIYRLPPNADSGRVSTGLYDYSDMGGARALAVGQVRAGLNPIYAAFVATNSSGETGSPNKGIEVFAIDVATGQKLWQWERTYSASWTDNTVPTGVTLQYGETGVERVYVGDMEGRIWELESGFGQNANVVRSGTGCSATTPCKYALFDTQSSATDMQPITTNLALARIPNDVTTGSSLAKYAGARVLIAGTGGANWVGNAVDGRLHLVLLDSRWRIPLAGGTLLDATAVTEAEAKSRASERGVTQEPAPFPRVFSGGEHLFGNITVAGRTALFSSAVGGVNDVRLLGARPGGGTYSMDLGNIPTSGTFADRFNSINIASYGGSAVFSDGAGGVSVLTATVSKLNKYVAPAGAAADALKPNSQLAPSGRNGRFYDLLNVLQRFLP